MECECFVEDFESPDFCEDKIVIAKKEHICCECRDTIKIGEQYETVRGLWSGKFSTYKTCLPCRNIRETYCHCGYVFGDLRNTLFDCLEFDYTTNEGIADD